MKFRRIVSVALILILFVVCFSFESFAVKIDGSFLDKEWKSAAQTVLVSTSDTANCDISYGMIYVYCDESASRIYIGFKAKATAKIDEKIAFGQSVENRICFLCIIYKKHIYAICILLKNKKVEKND